MNNKKRNAFCSYCFVMTKRVILSLLLVLCLLATCPAQSVTLTISNPTSAQRSELVAIDAATLGIEVGKGVVVRDVSNIERPTQWTHDGKLLMEVHVRPHGKAVFTLQPGTPAAFLSWVDGRQYPATSGVSFAVKEIHLCSLSLMYDKNHGRYVDHARITRALKEGLAAL